MPIYDYNFLGSLFIPKEKVNEFVNLIINKDDTTCLKVKIKQTKKFKRYQIKSFIYNTYEEYSNIIYLEFIENVYGDLFLSNIERVLGGNMIYLLIKLGFVLDYWDLQKYKEELRRIK